jgi:hypothetical protein
MESIRRNAPKRWEIFSENLEKGIKRLVVLWRHFFWWGIMHRNFISTSPVFLNW